MKETVSACFFLKTAYNTFVLRPDLHPGTLTFSLERQSARMSKITNDGLTRSGTGRFIVVVPKWQQCALLLHTSIRGLSRAAIDGGLEGLIDPAMGFIDPLLLCQPLAHETFSTPRG